jgi:thiol-disulfide isomerase/thioredoxin
MKNLLCLLGFSFVAVRGSLCAAEPPIVASPSSAADVAWADLQSAGLLDYSAAPNSAAMSRRELTEWHESRALLLREKGIAFLELYPTDPRRWSVVWRMINRRPQFVQSYGANFQADYRDIVLDTAAAEAWKAKLAGLAAAQSAASDVPAEVREQFELRRLSDTISEVNAAERKKQPADWTVVTRAVLAYAAKYPANPQLVSIVRSTMYRYEGQHRPAESLAAWQPFVDVANAPLAEMAREKVRAFSAIMGEIDLQFVAVDGREVDLKKLRGKAVLLEFWATWCSPCLAEMPNIKRVYAAYHDQGFEIIGVSCDVAPLPGDKPQKAGMAKTAEQVLEFKAQHGMPWPDYYDGRKHNEGGNALAQRFAVTAIPASFLIDQSGHVVAMNLKGEKLEAAVKQLLGL